MTISNRKEVTRVEFKKNSERFDIWKFKELCIYEKASDLMVEESKFKGRPINVLDIGCGNMLPLVWFWRSNRTKKSTVLKNYIGVDIDESLSPPVQSDEINIRIINKDFAESSQLSFDDGYFDLVICNQFIEHISKVAQVSLLSEIRRVTAMEGLLYLTTLNGGIKPMKEYHIYEPPLLEMLELLKRNWRVSNYGMTIDMRNVKKAMDKYSDLELTSIHEYRAILSKFGGNMRRIILSTLFPEFSDNVVYMCRRIK